MAVRSFAPKFVFTAMQRIESRLRKMNASPEKRAPMDPELRARLKREFAPEVDRLGELLGRDLTHWNEDRARPERQPIHSGTAKSALA